ncbi:tyrosine-type recombinase/integrase [Halomonas sp. 86]|uniref:tyrosine-type recombinase/integrase n=1 Tax=unclassified Halomonas TaxID=2609666 RepID=UPI004034A9B3
MPYKRPDSPYWWVYLSPPGGGEPIRRSTRTTDKQAAEALEGKWKAQLYRQSYWDEAPERSFAEVATEYLLASQDKRSLSDIMMRTGKLYDFFGADKVMGTLEGADIRAFIAYRQSEGVGPATINRELAILAAMITHAVTHMEWSLPNPVKGRMLKEPPGRVRWITRKEADTLIEKAKATREGDRLADFIELALHTGARKGELLKLEWRRVNWEHTLITLEPEDSKAGKRRTIPLNEPAVAALSVGIDTARPIALLLLGCSLSVMVAVMFTRTQYLKRYVL